MLSKDQLEFYREEGYLLLDNFLKDEQLSRLRCACDEMIESSKLFKMGDKGYDFETGHSQTTPRPRRISRSRYTDPIFDEINADPKILEIVTQIVGPNIRTSLAAIAHDPEGMLMYGLKVNIKWPGSGTPFEWHQDWAFLPHTNDDLMVFSILIDDVEDSSGPLMVIPGSHKGEIFDHHNNGKFCGGINPATCGIDFSTAVKLTGKAGTAHIHHTRMVHGSAINTSNSVRRIFFLDYAAADAWPLVGVANLDAFNSRMMQGETTTKPRLKSVPVRMPLPARIEGAAIFTQQEGLAEQYFKRSS